MFLKVDRDFDT